MNKIPSVLAVCGSSGANSVNETILHFIKKEFSDRADVLIYKGISNLVHFNPDTAPEDFPEQVSAFLKMLTEAEGVFICSPEYVFSLPGSLKNALEWTVASTVFSNKPVGFIIASGMGEKAFESLDLIISTLRQRQVPDSCKLLIKGAKSLSDSNGKLKDASAGEKIKTVFQNFLQTISEKRD